MAFKNQSRDSQRLRPFGCKAWVRSVKNKLSTFTKRLQDVICLLHSGGRVYYVMTNERVIRTKHVRFIETKFPYKDHYATPSHHDENSCDIDDQDVNSENVTIITDETLID